MIYPGEFKVRREEMDASGVVHEYDDALSGEAWPGGPVILSWQDVTLGEAGYNVVIHEFAHKLHMSRGDMDDFPAPHADMQRERWLAPGMRPTTNFCDQVDRGIDTVIDPYASEQPAEFFAVLSEAFFTLPLAVRSTYPELYGQLALVLPAGSGCKAARAGLASAQAHACPQNADAARRAALPSRRDRSSARCHCSRSALV